MRIAIVALGTRGDVQPYVALGKGLQTAGHNVRLLTHENFEPLVKGHGLEFWSMRGNVQEIAESEEIKALLEKGNFLAITAKTAQAAKKATIEWAEDGLPACRGMDVILAGIGGLFIALAFAEKLDIPIIQAHILPFTPTASFPAVLFPPSLTRLGGTFNRLSHHITRQIIWQGSRAADNAAREALGLPSASLFGPYNAPRLKQAPVIYGFSPSVIPKPSDWDGRAQVTGYWSLAPETGWTPPGELVDFLNNGAPPIYIGFGSMSSRKPEETAEMVLQAITRTGQRAILLSGWGGLTKTDLPESVFMIESIPHDWLFPRMAAVIHHGGAGTTAAGLRAGVPSIITPFFGDQPFWGQRVADLGVGTAPIPRKQLTVDLLAQAIDRVMNDAPMRERAAALGAKICAEAGIEKAVKLIEGKFL